MCGMCMQVGQVPCRPPYITSLVLLRGRHSRGCVQTGCWRMIQAVSDASKVGFPILPLYAQLEQILTSVCSGTFCLATPDCVISEWCQISIDAIVSSYLRVGEFNRSFALRMPGTRPWWNMVLNRMPDFDFAHLLLVY